MLPVEKNDLRWAQRNSSKWNQRYVQFIWYQFGWTYYQGIQFKSHFFCKIRICPGPVWSWSEPQTLRSINFRPFIAEEDYQLANCLYNLCIICLNVIVIKDEFKIVMETMGHSISDEETGTFYFAKFRNQKWSQNLNASKLHQNS